MEWLAAVNVDLLIKEILNLKANQEELTKRMNELENRLIEVIQRSGYER